MTVLGGDISHWQELFDWVEAYNAGWRFGFIRAGSINNYTGELYYDYQWPRNSELGPAEMYCGAYWYFRPNWSPVDQAVYFANLYNSKEMLLPAVADIEYSGAQTQSQNQASILAFLTRLENETGKKPLIYTRATFWNPYVGNPAWATEYDLWIARYGDYLAHPWVGGPSWDDPNGWKADSDNWKFWQWTDTALGTQYGAPPPPAASYGIDLNRFNGTEDDLRDYCGVLPPGHTTLGGWAVEVDKWARNPSMPYDGPEPPPVEQT